jgi:hypothetical protein
MVATLLPLAALGEIVGYRRVYVGGMALFTRPSSWRAQPYHSTLQTSDVRPIASSSLRVLDEMPFEDRHTPSPNQLPLYRMPFLGALAPQHERFLGHTAGFDDLIFDTFVDPVKKCELYLVVPQVAPHHEAPVRHTHDEALETAVNGHGLDLCLLSKPTPERRRCSVVGAMPVVSEHAWND